MTSASGGRYAFDKLRIPPLPLQPHVPIMIGGAGERKTLRIVAEHADMWNVFGTPEIVARKDEILRAHCADVGRDPEAIERTLGCKVTIRSTEAEAERVRLSLLEHNRTPLTRVEGDTSFWTGTPEQIAETIRLPAGRLPHVHRGAAGAVRRGDDGVADQRREADGRERARQLSRSNARSIPISRASPGGSIASPPGSPPMSRRIAWGRGSPARRRCASTTPGLAATM